METTYRRFIRIYSLGLIWVAILLGAVPFAAIAADTIKIGVLEALSGPQEYTGRFWLAGLQFAIDEQNAKGGLFGKKIEYISEDSEWKADVANRKARKLIMEDQVDILASAGASAVSIALNKVATSYKKLFILYGANADDLMGREFSRYAFRVAQNSHNIYTALALSMANKPYRRFYVMTPDNVVGYSFSKTFKEQIKIHVPDAKIVGEDNPPLFTVKDFGPYITKIIAAKADAVTLGLFGPDLINMIKQSRAMGLKAPFPFLTHIAEPYPMNELKDDGVGLYSAGAYSLNVKTPENQEMIKKYHEKHKNDKDFLTWWPFGYLGQGIIGWRMTFAAIEKAGSLDPEKVIEAFEGFQYKSAVGLWTMRKCDHQVILPMYSGVTVAGWNAFYNGSIRPDVKLPWEGPNIEMFPAEKVALPATSGYNPRCP